jgi:antitoxin (DNA-binding transcriptional repressor) of toxin-antitoxin stability system
MMKTLNIHEAKTHLSAVLVEVTEKGETFLICRNGKPVADLVPHRAKNRLTPHPVMSKIKIRYDPTEVLSPEEWRVEGG